jgi:AcrR family transcriptional regulator
MSPANDTAERILAAASESFATRGYSATTTRGIAERAGVNEVTVFRHFESKLGILRALGERWNANSAARVLENPVAPEDTRGTLLDLARAEIASSIENGGVSLRLAFDAASVPELAELMHEEGPGHNLEALVRYLAKRQAAGDLRSDIAPMVLAEAFAALTSSYVMYRMVMGLIDRPDDALADTTVEQLFDVFWSGAESNGA